MFVFGYISCVTNGGWGGTRKKSLKQANVRRTISSLQIPILKKLDPQPTARSGILTSDQAVRMRKVTASRSPCFVPRALLTPALPACLRTSQATLACTLTLHVLLSVLCLLGSSSCPGVSQHRSEWKKYARKRASGSRGGSVGVERFGGCRVMSKGSGGGLVRVLGVDWCREVPRADWIECVVRKWRGASCSWLDAC